jgi:CheY-like chemotaxis protein
MIDKSKISVLVIDDDSAMIEVTRLALEAAGLTDITTAEDGLAAKVIVGKTAAPFSLVICDWVMPKLDGPGFLKFFRSIFPDVPFIMLTGRSSAIDFDKLLHSENDHFMSKQSSFNDIRNRVMKVLGIT